MFRFNPTSRLWRILDSLGSVIVITLFWLLSLALVVTAGAGTVVAYEVCRRHVLGKDADLWAVATKAWRQSWRQATLIGLLAVPVAAVGILTISYLPTLGLAEVVVPLVVVGLFLVLLVFWCLPLAARFTNPTWRQVRNGFTLGLTTPSLTFLLGIALVLGGVAVWNFMPAVFVAPGLILLWWCYLLERFFVARGYVRREPEETEV
ncbi:protein of unknown function DUF624 [Xylanimonas cellulosilytica DSM 15894]|uniref:Uncharacterized protein n=1 Tax=Xylanimonas cellulosilytica (strain DSM 15894 / JCM 12276 / CECT 5975 / KCTC 9989 / LMG 20990 / NBRC 107835 / XIL07) TaxID=446471 RepID=D1BYC9_XYLCX|nr:protein of unknown function DUF624 [Xylanimonas cellulosilytica DSM 15894]